MAIRSTDQNIDMFRFKISEIQYSISSTVSRINKKLLKKFDSDRIKKSDAIKERIDKSMESLKSDLEELKKLALFAEDQALNSLKIKLPQNGRQEFTGFMQMIGDKSESSACREEILAWVVFAAEKNSMK